ncbi:pantoate--beta-alanine ligase [Nocardioides pantholopis]|uniref:pantoate--beta-alanine ligase n=1 Tax=Nocardioides pantholopis TaxID=2483798 RepID=UPI000F096189|nr:pantoate--beta-alanine ligase [Nocardioides pantholopis]
MTTTRPLLARTREELAGLLSGPRSAGHRVGLVPTMGALHDGHASLMRTAREQVGPGPVVVSIFVNPLQFGPGEDLDRYPRSLEADLDLCAREGVDVVFAPAAEEVYPGGISAGSAGEAVTVDPGPLADILEGRTRPGHFRGVLTVVAKLFGLVRPDVAVFGQKDYQQLVLVRRMVADLCLGVDVVGAETVRESDGLARSSRNRYLGETERGEAVWLSRALHAAQQNAGFGAGVALDEARAELRRAKAVELDYLIITTPDLEPLPAEVPPGIEARILVAARVGSTRLIDNLPLHLGARPGSTTSVAGTNHTQGVS